jgi:hypothetical protein
LFQEVSEEEVVFTINFSFASMGPVCLGPKRPFLLRAH